MKLFGIFQAKCLICNTKMGAPQFLCERCMLQIPYLSESACTQCAEPIPASGAYCGACLSDPPYFDQTHSIFVYDDIIRYLVQRLKFYEDFSVLPFLAEWMTRFLKKRYAAQMYPDVILPVPLYWTRLCKRGFNQTSELGKMLSKNLGVPIQNQVLRKVKKTQSQAELHFDERAQNLKSAFAVQPGWHANSVAIVDDVMTTGATVNEIAKILKKQGVERVEIWTLARAVKQL